jgi:hypothetical protein
MKTYRIYASSIDYLYLEIEAENLDQAWEIARDSDGGDYKRQGMGDWHIDAVELKEGDYTCPKFEPAQEEV